MITQIEEATATVSKHHPFLSTAFVVFIILLILLGAIAEYFKSVGKLTGKNGKPPRLRPGPRGLPILGNLMALKQGRHDSGHELVRYDTAPIA